MLAQGNRPSMVAEALSVSRETISRWRGIPAFNELESSFHNEFLRDLLNENLHLLNKSHRAIEIGLSDDNAPKIGRANLAIRYLAACGLASNGYARLSAASQTNTAASSDSSEAFLKTMEVLDLLASLKTIETHLSDAEYREKISNIIERLFTQD